MNQLDAFKNFVYVVPVPIQRGQGDINLRWDFNELSIDLIEDVVPGCGCTAQLSIDNTGISAVYKDNTKESDVPKNAPWFYPTKKAITVYIRDGEPIKIPGPKGMTFNPKKKQIKLYLHACVL